MKFLILGLGSMGKRRIRNLHYLGYQDITGFDIRVDRLNDANKLYGIDIVESLEDLDFSSFTHIIISTPPDQHINYATQFYSAGKHVFLEASVVDDGYTDLLTLVASRSNILAPSCTMRFDPINVQVKDWLEGGRIGMPLFCQHHFGMYLPLWHPYESIHEFYVSKRNTGGAREIVPFDLVYLTWFFGLPSDFRATLDRTGRLSADIDDIYSIIFRAPRCRVVQMTIDVLSQVPYRTTRIVGEIGNIEIDTVAGTLRLYEKTADRWIYTTRTKLSKTTSTEEMYIEELNCFLDATQGLTKYPYSLEDDYKILQHLYSIEKAAVL